MTIANKIKIFGASAIMIPGALLFTAPNSNAQLTGGNVTAPQPDEVTIPFESSITTDVLSNDRYGEVIDGVKISDLPEGAKVVIVDYDSEKAVNSINTSGGSFNVVNNKIYFQAGKNFVGDTKISYTIEYTNSDGAIEYGNVVTTYTVHVLPEATKTDPAPSTTSESSTSPATSESPSSTTSPVSSVSVTSPVSSTSTTVTPTTSTSPSSSKTSVSVTSTSPVSTATSSTTNITSPSVSTTTTNTQGAKPSTSTSSQLNIGPKVQTDEVDSGVNPFEILGVSGAIIAGSGIIISKRLKK